MIKEKFFKKVDILKEVKCLVFFLNGFINICDLIVFKYIRLFFWRIKILLLIYDLLME